MTDSKSSIDQRPEQKAYSEALNEARTLLGLVDRELRIRQNVHANHWGDAGDAQELCRLIKEVHDFAYQVGEYAA